MWTHLVASKVVQTVGRRQMSSTAKVWVDKNTKVICQGFTGKQVSQKLFKYG
jgi:succinyl-CoA synthetase alpha subunit